MKKTVIKCVYIAAVFLLALFLSSIALNQGNTEMTMEMAPATYPIIRMFAGDREVNSLHGYKDSMETSFQRDCLTPLGEGRRVVFTVDKYGASVESLSFEVRSIDGSRLVESTKVSQYEETEETIRAEFAIKDLIEGNTEYMLVLLLEDGNGRTIYYYTRIIQAESYYADEKIDYVLDFHKRTFDKEAAKELTKYLESNSEGDNTTYSKVTIHSSFNQVTWGELAVKKVTEPDLQVKELSTQTGAFELNYIVSLGQGKHINLFRVKEFYRIRYTSDRIYLLDFERTMKQVFDEKSDVFNNNKIKLGITSPSSISLAESDGGNVLAFTDGNQLYCYNITEDKLSRLFGFYNGDYSDARVTWQKHEIKILNVDESGNVQFIVYGYMNRGKHEGEVGIAVYHFSGPLNTVEELAYIPSDSSFEVLQAEIDQLSYINKSGIFFFIHEGTVYAVNLENRTCEVMIAGLTEGSFKVSDSNRMLVWQTGRERHESKKLILMNLNTKEKTEIDAGAGEYIAPLGFMGEDLIYGLAKSDDIVHENTGSILFPMYYIKIQNESGEVLKSYKQSDTYVVGSEIQGNQINLYRVKKEESGSYVEIANDQIINTKIETVGNNMIETVATQEYQKIVQIAVKSAIDTKALKRLTPKEVLFEGDREIVLKEKEDDVMRYYVYSKDGISGIFTDEGNAVNLAYELSGIVVNEKGDYVWIRGNRSLKNQIMAIKEAGITEEKNSLAVCLDTILQYEGVMRNSEYLLSRGENILDIMRSNLEDVRVLDLTGCSLDAILYYTNKDIPVLATLNDGSAVLIIGFNELNTVLMDPLTGTIYKKGMNDSKQMFEENGNRFITYIREK